MSARQLWLVRHARAAWEHGGQTDFDRVLTPDGHHHAAALAEWLRDRAPLPDAIVSSPAPRALATAEHLTAAWPEAPDITLEPRLYEAALETPVRLLAALPEHWHRVLVVGHNPSLSHCADWLIGEPTVLELPAGGLAWLDIDAPRWEDLTPGCARLHALHAPAMTARAG